MGRGELEVQVRSHLQRGLIQEAIALWGHHTGLSPADSFSQLRSLFPSELATVIDAGAQRSAQATAKFASGIGAARPYAPGLIWLGRDPHSGEPVGVKDDRHIVTIAGTRGGKGISAIIPNLCDYPGSVICIDPKGELATVTASRRGNGSAYCHGMGQRVVVLDPFGIATVDPQLLGSFNPLDELDAYGIDAIDHANAIADTLVIEKDPKDAHWNEYGKQVIASLILFTCAYCQDQQKNLGFVRDLLTRGFPKEPEPDAPPDAPPTYTGFDVVLGLMAQSGIGPVAAMGSTLQSMPADERGSVLTNARRNTAFLDSPRMRQVLRSSSFQLEELKSSTGGLSLFLCLPVKELTNHGRWLRLLVMLSLERIERLGQRPTSTGYPVLFVLDEFAALGHMRSLEVAAGFIAGYGVKLWTILQDLGQLKGLYKDSWATFLGNAGIVQAFANTDPPTLEYLSKRLGDTEFKQRTRTESTSRSTSESQSINESRTAGGSQSWSKDQSLTREPRGWIFKGKKISETASNSTSWSKDNSATRGTSSDTSNTIGQDVGFSETIAVAPLMRPDEIERRFGSNAEEQLVLLAGEHPITLVRVKYHEDGYFEEKYDPHPAHPDSAPQTLAERERLAREALEAERLRELSEAQQQIQVLRQASSSAKSSRRLKIGWAVGIAAVLLIVNLGRIFRSDDPPRTPQTQAPAPTVTAAPAGARSAAPAQSPGTYAAPSPPPATTATAASVAPSAPPAQAPPEDRLVIGAIGANLRAEPSLTSAVITALQRGDLVTVVSSNDGFFQVRTQLGAQGWLSARVVMVPESLQRLQNIGPNEFIGQTHNKVRLDMVLDRLKPLQPMVQEIRNRLAQQQSVVDVIQQIDHTRAVSIIPDADAAVWFSSDASAAARNKDYQKAFAPSAAAVMADPANADNWVAYGIAAYRTGRADSLRSVAEIVPALLPAGTNAWYLSGLARAMDGQVAQARDEFILAMALSKNTATTRKVFADTAAEAGDAGVRAALTAALDSTR